MPTDPNDASRDDPRLNEILAQYLQTVEAGNSPDPEQLLREHPEYANELREFLADKGHIDEIADAANVVVVPSGGTAANPIDMPTVRTSSIRRAQARSSVCPRNFVKRESACRWPECGIV